VCQFENNGQAVEPRMRQSRAVLRIDHDFVGEKAIPGDVSYDVQTARALENFHISGVPISRCPDLIRAPAVVKLPAARANRNCRQSGEDILRGMEGACHIRRLIIAIRPERFRLSK